MIIKIMLREGVQPPAGITWLEPGEFYNAQIILVADQEAHVRIFGPGGARCVMSSRDVRRISDDWPEH